MSAAPGRGAALATVALVVVTAVWGSTFFLIKDVVQRMAVADFLAVRFVVAALAMVLMFARPLWRLPRRQWLQGLALGALYGAAQLLQTTGQIYASASVSGFVTGMYVVFTPLLGTVLLRQRMPSVTWVAVLLATGGLALLSLQGFSVNKGVRAGADLRRALRPAHRRAGAVVAAGRRVRTVHRADAGDRRWCACWRRCRTGRRCRRIAVSGSH